jgi:hypothetical protein
VSSVFHAKCDGHSNTASVIETTTGFIFGRFTPFAWDFSSYDKSDASQRSFLFTVKNPLGNEGRKFPRANSDNPIYSSSVSGPSFGSDIRIGNACNSNSNSYTHLGGAYTNNTEIDGQRVFTGERSFIRSK